MCGSLRPTRCCTVGEPVLQYAMRDAEAGEIILFLHWMGGIHTELRLPRRRRGQRNSTSQDIVTVRQLVLIVNDELIAGILNRNKLTTGRGNRWSRERVTALRSHHKIPVYCPAEQSQEPWLNLSKAAAYLQISPKTLRLAAECGENRQQPALLRYQQRWVLTLDQRATFGSAHLPSFRAKKSFSTFNWPIWRYRTST